MSKPIKSTFTHKHIYSKSVTFVGSFLIPTSKRKITYALKTYKLFTEGQYPLYSGIFFTESFLLGCPMSVDRFWKKFWIHLSSFSISQRLYVCISN